MGSEPNHDDSPQGLGQSLDLGSLQNLSIGPDWSDPDFKQKAPDIPSESEGRGKGKGERRSRRKFDRPKPQGDSGAGGDRQRPSGDNRQRSDDGRGGPRRDGDNRGRGGPRRDNQRQAPFRPVVEVNIYPDDAPFKKLSQVMRQNCRTYELFEIANIILQKAERFVVVMKPFEGEQAGRGPQTFFISSKDGVPFETEEEAVAYAFKASIDDFFETEEIEVEPPKGAFNMINKCGVTGELLGPPNYHRYTDLLREHHAQRLPRMSFEGFQRKIESVKDEETVNTWLEKMRKQTRYTWKGEFEGDKKPIFESTESARHYVTLYHKASLVKEVNQARFNGALIEAMPAGSRIRKSIESVVEYQKRFPLDTANHLRGRLRRLNFAVYKKGTKGVSYTCAVKRKFRQPGEVFSDDLQEMIEYIERNPEINTAELLKMIYQLELPDLSDEAVRKEFEEKMTPSDKESLGKFTRNVRWLVSEGYVIEMADGRMIAVPAMEAKSVNAATPAEKAKPAKEETAVAEETCATPSAEAEAAAGESTEAAGEAEQSSEELPKDASSEEPGEPAIEAKEEPAPIVEEESAEKEPVAEEATLEEKKTAEEEATTPQVDTATEKPEEKAAQT